MKQQRRFLVYIFAFIIVLPGCKKDPATDIKAEAGENLSGGAATVVDLTENAFGREIPGLSGDEETRFVIGNSFFRNNWVTAPASADARDGLGPVFNATSCGGCHFKDGRAEAAATSGPIKTGLLFRISLPGTGLNGGPIIVDNYGDQLNDKGLLGVQPEVDIQVNYEEIPGKYPDGTPYSLRKPTYTFNNAAYGALPGNMLVSPRIAQSIHGLGLLEAVSEATILAMADDADINGDGISGRANYVWDVSSSSTILGRFGWKANQPSIRQQVAGAFLGDIGITSSIFPNENIHGVQLTTLGSIPNGGTPEISDENLNEVVFYTHTLAVPARRNYNDPIVLQGKQLFNQIKCTSCHVPQLTTGAGIIPQLSYQKIWPYTDMLLHDMGDGLADGRPDFWALGNEWRTPPLWGIGLTKTVNGHTNFLHDGRARNFEEAILWHGGEATRSVDSFKQLSKSDRDKLIKFLESL
jgi:CxxC motif-containing protein (DUF1111 family)